MRMNSAPLAAILLLAALSVFAFCRPDFASAAENPANERSVPFFSQGQSVYDPQDSAKSQQQAIREFQAQALIQAAGMFLSPAQIGVQFSDFQKKILAQPQKYVDSYQILSETQAGGLYRVIGQVSVSVDLLRNDMKEAGFPVEEEARQQTAAAAEEPEAEQPAESEQTDAPESQDLPATATTLPQVRPQPVEQASRPGSRGLSVTKKEVLWVVPEKWEQEWVIPTGKRDSGSLFAQSIGRELDDYDYTLHFAEPGSLKIDHTGNVPLSQVVALAQGLGIQQAVVGVLEFGQEQNKPPRLEASLRVLKVAAGKAEGQVTRVQSMEELSNQEGALELASRVAPQLNSLLGQTGEAAGTTPASGPAVEKQPAKSGVSPESWTINLPTVQYAYWKEVEKLLREQFKNMQISSLEMGADEGTVRLKGVDGSFISRMNGTSLPSGALIHIDSYSTETQTIKASFTPPATVQDEPKR